MVQRKPLRMSLPDTALTCCCCPKQVQHLQSRDIRLTVYAGYPCQQLVLSFKVAISWSMIMNAF